jgi:hypothetical protein
MRSAGAANESRELGIARNSVLPSPAIDYSEPIDAR